MENLMENPCPSTPWVSPRSNHIVYFDVFWYDKAISSALWITRLRSTEHSASLIRRSSITSSGINRTPTVKIIVDETSNLRMLKSLQVLSSSVEGAVHYEPVESSPIYEDWGSESDSAKALVHVAKTELTWLKRWPSSQNAQWFTSRGCVSSPMGFSFLATYVRQGC